jgi:hypothetical protein
MSPFGCRYSPVNRQILRTQPGHLKIRPLAIHILRTSNGFCTHRKKILILVSAVLIGLDIGATDATEEKRDIGRVYVIVGIEVCRLAAWKSRHG